MPSFREAFRVLKPSSFCVSFYGWPHADVFLTAWRTAGFTPVGHLVGVKTYASKSGFLKGRHETAYLLAKGQPRRPAEPISDVLPWMYTGNCRHPNEKPVGTLESLVGAFSEKGNVILDPFAGSGAVAVAALRSARSYIAIEKDREYHRIARGRLWHEHQMLKR